MEWADLARVALRWAHAVAALLWVGGSLFLFLVYRPAVRVLPEGVRPLLEKAVRRRFRELVNTAIVVLLVSGVALTFDRLSSPAATTPYVLVLGAKVVLALLAFYLALELGGGRRLTLRLGRHTLGAPEFILAIGLGIYLLVAALRVLYERGLAP